MTKVRKLILLFLASLVTCGAMAREDALCTWTTITFDKSFGKWSAGLMSEYRHRIHEGVSGMHGKEYIAVLKR